MRSYSLDMPLWVRLFPFVFFGSGPVLFPVFGFLEDGWAPIAAIATGCSLALLWNLARLVYRVVVHDDGTVEFVALRRRVRVRPEDIKRIGPVAEPSVYTFFVIKHARGTEWLVNQFPEIREIVDHVRDRHPAVVIRE